MGESPIRFVRPNLEPVPRITARSEIRAVQDLVLFNTAHNPEHVFCYQSYEAEDGSGLKYTSITFSQLAAAVENCCSWILSRVDGARPGESKADGSISKSDPIALFFESSVTLFICVVALTTLHIPVSV